MTPSDPKRPNVTKSPLVHAIDCLWRDIILARKPNYGDWFYGGEAYNHIMDEVREIIAERDQARAALRKVLAGDLLTDAERAAVGK